MATTSSQPARSASAPSSMLDYKGQPPQQNKPRFFKLYKPGQGYWTRMGTAGGAALVILFIAWFVVQQSPLLIGQNKPLQYVVAGVFTVIAGLVAWWLVNAPSRAQFLIDTDSEMKKVNWATRKELVGSTMVVVFFMLLIAFTLFFYDVVFHFFFWSIGVWKIAPFGLYSR